MSEPIARSEPQGRLFSPALLSSSPSAAIAPATASQVHMPMALRPSPPSIDGYMADARKAQLLAVVCDPQLVPAKPAAAPHRSASAESRYELTRQAAKAMCSFLTSESEAFALLAWWEKPGWTLEVSPATAIAIFACLRDLRFYRALDQSLIKLQAVEVTRQYFTWRHYLPILKVPHEATPSLFAAATVPTWNGPEQAGSRATVLPFSLRRTAWWDKRRGEERCVYELNQSARGAADGVAASARDWHLVYRLKEGQGQTLPMFGVCKIGAFLLDVGIEHTGHFSHTGVSSERTYSEAWFMPHPSYSKQLPYRLDLSLLPVRQPAGL